MKSPITSIAISLPRSLPALWMWCHSVVPRCGNVMAKYSRLEVLVVRVLLVFFVFLLSCSVELPVSCRQVLSPLGPKPAGEHHPLSFDSVYGYTVDDAVPCRQASCPSGCVPAGECHPRLSNPVLGNTVRSLPSLYHRHFPLTWKFFVGGQNRFHAQRVIFEHGFFTY